MFDVRLDTTADDEIVAVARHLVDHALGPELRDDRFSDSWVREINDSTTSFVAAVATGDHHPVGFLGGTILDGHLQLDALVSPHSRWEEAIVFDALLRATIAPDTAEEATDRVRIDPDSVDAVHLDLSRVQSVEVWGKPAHAWHEAVLDAHGFEQFRALQQMRCQLPVAAEALETRAFRPGVDDEALISVNNRAFADHPDQGGWTQQTLEERMSEPWFEPEGIRLYEADGRLAGFCWTKIHDRPPLGEIYAIGVDPDFHGRGLGVPMTAAGLQWLAAAGMTVGMLYVECDNTPAVRTYERLGFTTVRTDRAWKRVVGSDQTPTPTAEPIA